MFTGKIRFALFLLFVGSFFIVSGSILFYAFGYRFNFERGIFVYGGSITLKSNPVQIDVSIDGVPIPAGDLSRINQSYHIAGIIPGEHSVEVSTPGYQSWNKNIVVRSGISNEFWNIVLPRQHYETVRYPGTENFTKYFQSPNPTVFAGIQERDHTVSIMMRDTDKEEGTLLYSRRDASFAFEKNENLEWSTAGDQIVFPVLIDNLRHIIIVNTETLEVRDISAELGQFSLMRPRWNPAVRNSLLYRSDGKLYRLDIGAGQETPLQPMLLAEHITTYDISGSDIFIANMEDGFIYRFGAEQTQPDLRSIADVSAENLQPGTTLIVYDAYRIALLSSDGALIFYNASMDDQPVRTLAEHGILGAQFSDDGKKLLFFSDHEISVYFIQEWDVQPKRDIDSIWQISRFADTISSVQWTKDYEHILYLKGSQVFLTELDNRDRRNINTLIEFRNPPLQILSRVNNNQIFFVSNDDTSPELVSILFPEFNGFFTQ